MMGLRFADGPRFSQGFRSGVKIPILSSFGKFPVSADMLKIFAMVDVTIGGLNLTCSALMSAMNFETMV